jgi:hypothetical protein
MLNWTIDVSTKVVFTRTSKEICFYQNKHHWCSCKICVGMATINWSQHPHMSSHKPKHDHFPLRHIFPHSKGQFTWVRSPKPQVTWGQSLQSQPLRAWNVRLPTSHGSQVLSPKHEIDAYMATLSGSDPWDLCWQLGRVKS